MKNIILVPKIIIAENLSLKKAFELLDKASDSPASKLITFAVTLDEKGTYTLTGRVDMITKAYLENPDDFIIQDVSE